MKLRLFSFYLLFYILDVTHFIYVLHLQCCVTYIILCQLIVSIHEFLFLNFEIHDRISGPSPSTHTHTLICISILVVGAM